jgi:hypothetical protein
LLSWRFHSLLSPSVVGAKISTGAEINAVSRNGAPPR